MDKNDMILVSVDDHVIEPPNMFDGFIPAKYADRAPRVVSNEISDTWVFLDGETRSSGLNAVAGRPPEEYGLEPARFDDMRRGCWDVHERVKDMSANGMLASLNFPSMARFCGQFFASRASQDPDLALAVVRAYNDWHLEAWCGSYPDRLIPCTIPPVWDPDLMAAEIHRTAAKGSHAVTFSLNPYGLGYPSLQSDHWDPFWAACQDTETVVTMHIGSGGIGVVTSPDAPMNVEITCSPIKLFPTAADLVWSPIFQKFRNLKIALAEGGIGWIPYFLERVDYVYQQHKAWTRPNLGGRLPSEIFNEHVITCFVVDDFGAENLHHLNEDMVTWECDYPHSDSTWPKSPEVVEHAVRNLTDLQTNKITHENAMRLFSFDPYAIRPREQCTVGALRAEVADHDISIVSRGVPEHAMTSVGDFHAAHAANQPTSSASW